MSGVLHITVEKADIYIDTETFGKMDPFVVLTLCQNEGMKEDVHKTKVKDNAGKNPVWDEKFEMRVTNMDLDLKVHILEEDVTSNDNLGQFTI